MPGCCSTALGIVGVLVLFKLLFVVATLSDGTFVANVDVVEVEFVVD